MISKYEIDFLSVGAADAILIHFVDDKYGERVIAIDAGRYGDGEDVAKFVRDKYHRECIDLAICTHCDDDHYGGFIKIIEEYKANPTEGVSIGALLVNEPGKYTKASDYKRYTSTPNAKEEARSVYTIDRNGKNLLECAKDAHIPMCEAFSCGGDFYQIYDGILDILGPTKAYYLSLVPDLRNNLQPYDTTQDTQDDTSMEYGNCISPKLDAIGDDDSTHNQSSIVVMFNPGDGKKFLFMADAGRAAFERMLGIDREKMKDVFILKVPHHGSKYNLDSTMINWIKPTIAVVSAQSEELYFSPLVKNALKRRGAAVYSTIGGGLWYNRGFDDREDYVTANPY